MKLTRAPGEVRGVDLPWPAFVGPAIAVAGVATALVVAAEHDDLVPPGPALLIGLVAVTPWVIDAVRPHVLPHIVSVVAVLGGVLAILQDPAHDDMAPFLLVFLATCAGALLSPLWGALETAAAIGVVAAVVVAGKYDDALPWYIGIAIAWAAGLAMQMQLRSQVELEAANERLAQQAVADERRRIAREVHDVVAHSLSVTLLQVTGARHALESGDAADAADGLHEAERLGRQALADIRRTVGLLSSESTATAAPMPTADDIRSLIDEFCAAGIPVGLRVRGETTVVDPGTGLELYRIVQESLTNAAKHAPGEAVTIGLDIDPTAIRLQVENAVPVANANGDTGGPPGMGLRGMRERAELLGGVLRAGRDNGTWRVTAEVPRS